MRRLIARLAAARASRGGGDGVDDISYFHRTSAGGLGRRLRLIDIDLADRCGALLLADRARETLVAAGARPRRARATGVGALTPAELRKARMAAAGRTNREIAEDLVVTIKAVKFHLGNAYRKLGVSSREDLPAALEPRWK